MGGSGAGTHRFLRFVPLSVAGKLRGNRIRLLFPYDNFPVFPGTDLCISGQSFPGVPKNDGLSPILRSLRVVASTGAQTRKGEQEPQGACGTTHPYLEAAVHKSLHFCVASLIGGWVPRILGAHSPAIPMSLGPRGRMVGTIEICAHPTPLTVYSY